MNVRDQIISGLLQHCDSQQRIIEELQKKIAELEKAAATLAIKEVGKKKDKPEEVK